MANQERQLNLTPEELEKATEKIYGILLEIESDYLRYLKD